MLRNLEWGRQHPPLRDHRRPDDDAFAGRLSQLAILFRRAFPTAEGRLSIAILRTHESANAPVLGPLFAGIRKIVRHRMQHEPSSTLPTSRRATRAESDQAPAQAEISPEYQE